MNRLPLVVWLTVVWVLLWGDLTIGNALAGLVLAVVLTAIFPIGPDRHRGVHPVAVLHYGIYFAWALVVATFTVAATLLRPRMNLEQGIVAIPLRAQSPVVVAFVANSISLTPGTLTVDIRPRTYGIDAGPEDRNAPVLYVHCLQIGDPEAVRADAWRIEELAAAAFGTPVDRAAVLEGGRS